MDDTRLDAKSKSKNDLCYHEMQGNGLKIAQLNVNSLLKHIDEIKAFVISNNVHVFAINESKLDETIFDDEVMIDNYNLVRKDRDRQGGGVAIYLHKSLHFDKINHETMGDLEIILLKVYLKSAKPVLISTWYRPPSTDIGILDLYERFLSFVDTLKCDIILTGDINCDLLAKPLSSLTKKYMNINDIYSVDVLNTTVATRTTDHSATLIDHMLTNNSKMVKRSGILDNSMSDHSISFLIWNSHIPSKPKFINFRMSSKIDVEQYKNDIRNQNWDSISIHDAVDLWQSLILEVVDKHMPYRSKRISTKGSPWMNAIIFKMMKKRDKLKRKANKLKDSKLMEEYRKLRNKITTEIRKAKKKYYSEKFANLKANPKQTWKTLKSIIPNKKSVESTISLNRGNDGETSLDISNAFNTFFAEVGSNLAKEIPNIDSPIENIHPGKKSFVFTPVSENDVFKIINSLKNTKSVGVDKISVYVLKLCAVEIANSITKLINFSLSSGEFPNQWKSSKIIPIHKSGDKNSPSNFRPISILSCVSKILERVVQKQVLEFLHDNNSLSSVQSGFRPRHSTTTTLLKVTDDWLQSIDKKQYTGVVFVDLKKAFDTVNCDVLIKKLINLGISDTPCQWFKSYMSNRVCRTLLNSQLSCESVIRCGVPQGSILGPLLFIIYINDLVKCIKTCKVQLYADDTVLYCSNTSIKSIELALNSDLVNLYNWMCQNKLSVNCNKTVCMLLGSKHMLSKEHTLNLILNNLPIEQVNQYKYLGLLVDERISWNLQIEKMLKRIGQIISFLARLKRCLNESVLKLIYNSMILPYFDYADVIYNSATKDLTDRLQKLQNRAGRIILNLKLEDRVSIVQIHDTLNWQPLDIRRKYHSLALMFKIMNNLAPEYLQNEIQFVSHSYPSRFGLQIKLPKPRTECLKRSFNYRIAKAYNSLPPDIKSSPSINIFKTKILDVL